MSALRWTHDARCPVHGMLTADEDGQAYCPDCDGVPEPWPMHTIHEDMQGDLLAALKQALLESGCDGDMCAFYWHDLARAAIAKAEGRA